MPADTHLGNVQLRLLEGAEAEIQLSQLWEVAEPLWELCMPLQVASAACPDVPGSRMQVYGQAGQSADPAGNSAALQGPPTQ